ncbi:MAG: hypothetical protein KA436_06340 [Oligoflexales bacterium]|nr:hypothetical protein [Oligoflexales bacterium]
MKTFLFCLIFFVENCFAQDFLLDPEKVPVLKEALEQVHSLDELHVLEHDVQRQTKCPLSSEDYADIVSKLTQISDVLGAGHCKNFDKKPFQDFSSLLTQVSKTNLINQSIFRSLYTQTDQEKKFITDPLVIAQAQNLLLELNEASKKEPCVNELKEKSLLSTAADLSISIARIAMVIPTTTGLIIGSAGVAVSSVIQLIKSLLSSSFTWDQEKDRSQFIALNCSFYKIRYELSDRSFFKIPSHDPDEKIKKIEDLLERLARKKNDFSIQKKELARYIQSTKENFFKEKLGEPFLQFQTAAKSLLSELETIPQGADHHLKFILFFLKYRTALLNYETLTEDHFSYSIHLKKIMTELRAERLEELSKLSTHTLEKQYLNPLKIYLQNSLDLLNKTSNEASSAFLALRHEDKTSNEGIIKKIDLYFLKIEQESSLMIELGQKQVQILKRHSESSSDRDGSHNSYSTLDEIHRIKALVTGKMGFSFLEHLSKDARVKTNLFYDGFKRWKRQYDLRRPSPLSWACRDARRLSLLWDQAHAGTEVIGDFLETNKGILSTNVPRDRLFLQYIPIGLSVEFKLFCYLRSLELAKQFVEEGTLLKQDSSCDEISVEKTPGSLYLKIKASTGARRELDWFLEENDCQVFL